MVFNSMLDSGATFPSLYENDLKSLGIAKDFYGAQSCAMHNTANGSVIWRRYEMHVQVEGNLGTPIVDPYNPVNPMFPPYVGGICPVSMIETPTGGPEVDANGFEGNARLSGLMPFVAPYVSITPSSNTILLGEDRNDVLGGHKMPPHRRWMVGLDQSPKSREYWERWGNPTITFNHRNGHVVDEDIGQAKTRVTVSDGAQEVFDPRGVWAAKQKQSANVVDPTEPGVNVTQSGSVLVDYLNGHFHRI